MLKTDMLSCATEKMPRSCFETNSDVLYLFRSVTIFSNKSLHCLRFEHWSLVQSPEPRFLVWRESVTFERSQVFFQ